MELQHTIIATFLDVTCERIMEALSPLERTLKETHEWSVHRMIALCNKSVDTKDIDYLDNADAIRREFDEWLDPAGLDHDIVSLEYIGEGSEYDE